LFTSVTVIGAGHVGSAITARLVQRAVRVGEAKPDLVLLCVPDDAIHAVAARVSVGPWIAHVSGATALAALAPHTRRFGVHPLQTSTRSRGPEQLDDAWAAVTAESEAARRRGFWLATVLGLHPFEMSDDWRALYHAGATMASSAMVAVYRSAARLLSLAGAPPDALVPLMQRTIDNGFELTGPAARGDHGTVDAHVRAIRAHAPDLERLYLALTKVTTR
jgi:predicted short-subunit dehydrogenase-like oxidoreductase (DUF2520 family)